MPFHTLEEALLFLEKNNQLIRVKEEVDPYLQMSAIHLRIYKANGPAILFENVKGSSFRAVSNIFGNLQRSKVLFAETLPVIQDLLLLKNDPLSALKKPLKHVKTAFAALSSFPRKNSLPIGFKEISLSELPQITHWPDDGGAFITLPQVYSENIEKPGVKNSNLGMYRVQLNGNEYTQNCEIGLHYQLHRGIGVHQAMANSKGQPLKISIFIGGPPAHSVAAVMPLPEGLSELSFAGVLAGYRFRYSLVDGYCISNDADFVITGEVWPGENKPEGPFGDHLGYYSLTHLFPVLRVHKVYAKENGIWPFTVVGRPPQEDTSFGALIHEITGDALKDEIPGLKEVNAVDASGVHPLLLAIGSERYTPYNQTTKPAEILTIANHVLGTGQLSLAKFLFITAGVPPSVTTHDIPAYINFFLERINTERDLHFYTQTTIDTLDYSGDGLNSGSKLVLAAYGEKLRELEAGSSLVPAVLSAFLCKPILPGIVAVEFPSFETYEKAQQEINAATASLTASDFPGIVFMILCDNAVFTAQDLNNFLWVTFTKTNPSHDIYGIESFTQNKHWGCKGPVIFDARRKPHHAPDLKILPATEDSIQHIFEKNGSLYGW